MELAKKIRAQEDEAFPASSLLQTLRHGVCHESQALIPDDDHGFAIEELRGLQRSTVYDHTGINRFALIGIQLCPCL